MSSKIKVALAAALIVGTASAALARGSYGGPVQTWQDIVQDRQDIQNKIRRFYHADTPDSAYGYVAPHRATSHPRQHAR